MSTPESIQDDPELCLYEVLETGAERRVRERFAAAFETAVNRLGVEPDAVGLAAVCSSIERNSDGHRWLKLLATDGTTWYSGWQGDVADAVSFAEEFGESIVESMLS
jgi:hypothetical protein